MLQTVRTRRESALMALDRIKQATSSQLQGVMKNGPADSADLLSGPVQGRKSVQKQYKPPKAPRGSAVTGSYELGKAAAIDDLFGDPPAGARGSMTKPVNVREILQKQAMRKQALGGLSRAIGKMVQGGTGQRTGQQAGGLAGFGLGGGALGGLARRLTAGGAKPPAPAPPAGPTSGLRPTPPTPPASSAPIPWQHFQPAIGGQGPTSAGLPSTGTPGGMQFMGGPPPEPTAPQIDFPDTSMLEGSKPPSGPFAEASKLDPAALMAPARPSTVMARRRGGMQSAATKSRLINQNIQQHGAGTALDRVQGRAMQGFRQRGPAGVQAVGGINKGGSAKSARGLYKQALGGIGTLIGALAGPLSAPEGHRVEGFGRGVGRGLGTDIGMGVGGFGGSLMGGAAGALPAILAAAGGNKELAAQLAAAGVPVGMGIGGLGGMGLGGILGYKATGKMMGKPSWKKDEGKGRHEEDKAVQQAQLEEHAA